MRKYSLTRLMCFLFLSGIILLSCCKKDEDDKKEIVGNKEVYLGFVMPLDIPTLLLGQNAIRLAVDDINQNGGVMGGYEIKIDFRSSEPSGAINRAGQAVIVANSIISDHLNNLIGLSTSFSTSSKSVVLQIADPQQIPVISASATADELSGISSYFHRLAPSDNYQTIIIAKKAKEYGINKVAIAIQKDDVFSSGMAKAFKENFEAEGGVITAEIQFGHNDPDYLSKLTDLYNGNPDAVLTAMLELDIDFLNQVNDHADVLLLDRSKIRFIFSDSQEDQNVLDQVPRDLLVGEVNGTPRVFGASSLADIESQSYKHFQNELKEKFDQDEISAFGPQSYDLVYIYALAMERAFKEGASLDDIDNFRKKVNGQIRKVSRDDNDETIVKPEQGWAAIANAANIGDVNYKGTSGNCDIDESGGVLTNYNVFIIEDDGSGSLSFKTIESISP